MTESPRHLEPNPYEPTRLRGSPPQSPGREWPGFSLLSALSLLLALAFAALGVFIGKVALVDAPPSPENRAVGSTMTLGFVLTGGWLLVAAVLFFRGAGRPGLYAAAAAPLTVIAMIAYLYLLQV